MFLFDDVQDYNAFTLSQGQVYTTLCHRGWATDERTEIVMYNGHPMISP